MQIFIFGIVSNVVLMVAFFEIVFVVDIHIGVAT